MDLTAHTEHTELGKSGVRVSKVGLGTWAIGGWMWGGPDDAQAIRTIHTAIDQGVTLIDTAPVYGFGHSEEVVGKAIAQHGNRDKIVLASKVGLEWDSKGGVQRNATPQRIVSEIEDSLRRLQTSYIDLYQVHWPDPLVPFASTGEALAKLKQAGKIRAIGVSNYSVSQMDEFARAAVIDVAQLPYNLFERQIEADTLPHARTHAATVLAYGAICRGLLSGKMSAGSRFNGDDLRKKDPKFQQPRFADYLEAVDELAKLAETRYQTSSLVLALRWVLDQGCVALWGARRPDQLEPLSRVWGWSLSPDTQAEVTKILRRCIPDPVGPEFMAPPARS